MKHLYPSNFSSIISLLLICFCLPFFTSCESRRTIVNGLDEREANEILVFLAGKGIDATKVQSTGGGGGGGGPKLVLWDISVDNDQALEAMSFLNQAGLPRRRSQNLLNIFTGAGLVPSEMEQKIRYQSGLAEQIASTIRKIDGILDAEVQVSFPPEDPLNPTAPKQPITASVYVKHNGVLEDPNAHLVTKIKRLVAASVPGLDYDNVTVIGERARFSETSIPSMMGHEDEKQYVTIWSIVLAKDSVNFFRILFFSFTVAILLLTILLCWLLWKIFPILRSQGGIKQLFHLKPFQLEKSAEEAPTEEKAVEEKSEEKEEDKEEEEQNEEATKKEKSLANKNVDQT